MPQVLPEVERNWIIGRCGREQLIFGRVNMPGASDLKGSASQATLLDRHHDEGRIVFKPSVTVAAGRLQKLLLESLGRETPATLGDFNQADQPELLAPGVASLSDPVGIKHEAVSLVELDGFLSIAGFIKA